MRLLLSSKGLVNEELTKTFLSFVNSKRKVSIITTASPKYKEKNKNTIDLQIKLVELGFEVRFVDIEFEDPKILKQSEIVIIAGGNPYYLLHHIKKGESEKLIFELISNQIPIWGISAGFMILMTDLGIIDILTPEMNHVKITDKNCLGLIEEIVIPHYDRFVKEGKIIHADVDKFEMDLGCRIIRLGEYQYLKYEGNRLSIIGELMK